MRYVLITLLVSFSNLCMGNEATLKPITNDLPKMRSMDEIVSSELSRLDNLIVMTQQNLQNQLALRTLLEQYQQIQAQHLQNDQDIEILFKLVKMAQRLFESIKQNHLTHLFEQDFLSELALFSQIANKRGIPRESQLNKD